MSGRESKREEERESNDNKLFTARELASKQALTLGADSSSSSSAADRDAVCAFCALPFIFFYFLLFAFLFVVAASQTPSQSRGDTVAPASVAFVQQPARQQKACQPFL